jgi:NAD(P)-dependent dehydrogenase (short-subunit alcohol dehydrogenase family)
MNPLNLDKINAVIVGNGAIGHALCESLSEGFNMGTMALLGRSPSGGSLPASVTEIRVDATEPESIVAAAERVRADAEEVHLLINTVGVLHREGQQPEKRLKEVQRDNAVHSFRVNALLLAELANVFGPAMRHPAPAVLASLAARVGSIEDNRLGGWYSYRVSKAAHNMLLRTIACEWKVSHRNAAVVALHPGTVRSRLSEPFITDRYANKVLEPRQSADALLSVIAGLTPSESGKFFDWQGEEIPW